MSPTIDFSDFKAPYLTKEVIREAAESFRYQYIKSQTLPINIEEIAEIDLGIELVPLANLRKEADIDALLSIDGSKIYIDLEEFESEKYQNRLRFSIAHEVGHHQLHLKAFNGVGVSTVDEWVNLQQAIPPKAKMFMEFHACEFAGRLLVPVDDLKAALDATKQMIATAGMDTHNLRESAALDYIADHISKQFGVSGQVIKKRLVEEECI